MKTPLVRVLVLVSTFSLSLGGNEALAFGVNDGSTVTAKDRDGNRGPRFESSKGAQPGKAFPLGPNKEMTPGDLCHRASEYRYQEKIPYCERDVSPSEKWDIIREYDRAFGYRIEKMNRQEFKIDHLIPLCAGGSNEPANLWPQHRSVYEKTDRIEEMVCRLMSMGRMRQDQAVALILEVKSAIETADEVFDELEEKL